MADKILRNFNFFRKNWYIRIFSLTDYKSAIRFEKIKNSGSNMTAKILKKLQFFALNPFCFTYPKIYLISIIPLFGNWYWAPKITVINNETKICLYPF